jgi:DNA-directed RNA polymerase specialized sigma24 family protein
MSLCDPYYTDEDLIGLQQFKDEAAPSQETLSYLSDIDRMKEQFNERQNQVFQLCWVQEYTMQEAASILDVTLGKVISANRGIKRIIDSYKKNIKKEMVF